MRKKVIAGNWKMNKTHNEAVDFISELVKEVQTGSGCGEGDKVIVAPFTALPALVQATENKCIKIGAQNMHYAENGAYTGEISAEMLVGLGVEYVVLGHSERRAIFGECNDFINKKVLAAHQHNLLPILCVGEELEDREKGTTMDIVNEQVIKGLAGLTAEQVKQTIIAYEPVWAIGTGKTATAEQANETCGWIRETIAKEYSVEVAEQIIIQYGGSVKPENVEELMSQEHIDGALVGGASLNPADFAKLMAHC